MALSGTFTKNVGSYWRLQLEWSATQNIANNTSTVTTRLYWVGIGRYSATYTSATKSGSSTIDGTNSSFSGSAKLSAGDKRLIKTHSKTISHDSDGTKSISMSAYFDIELTLSGTYYGRVSVSGSATLNTIPRASSLSSSASWTAGSNRSISISRASSAFTHTVKIRVDGTLIKTITGIRSSATASFSVSENTSIFNQLNGGSSKSTEIELITYNGGSHVGTKTYSGTVRSPSYSTTSFGGNFNIGETISGSISQKHSYFTHTIQLLFGGSTFTLHSKTTASSWSYDTSNIAASLYALTPDSNTLNGEIRMYTYYNGEQVGSYAHSDLKAYVKNSDPTFSSSQVTYKDTNTVTAAVTGNDQFIIQNLSGLDVYLNTAASARNYASIDHYEITVNGETIRMDAIGSAHFGWVDASSNVTMKVKVVDSRGNYTEVSKTISMIPYKIPGITPAVERTNGFGRETVLFASGNVSPMEIGGVNKNEISEVKYRIKPAEEEFYGAWVQMSISSSGNNYNVSPVTLDFDNTKSYHIQFQAVDKFSTAGSTKLLEVGRPIFSIDSSLNSMAFNDFPRNPNEFLINGRIVFGSTMWASTTDGENNTAGAMDLNNSDIVKVNGIYFNDVANNNGEGLLFLRSGIPHGSINHEDYDNFRIYNGTVYLNDVPVLTSDGGILGSDLLWSGAIFMQENQEVRPSKNMQSCPNGWILCWSEYVDGAETNAGWQYTFFPKKFGTLSSGGSWVQLNGNSGTPAAKYIYMSDTLISGHSRNNDVPQNQIVLRFVYSW